MTTETATIVVQGRWANEGGWFDIKKCETMEEAGQSCEHAIDQYNASVQAFGNFDRGEVKLRIITRRSVVTEAVLKEFEVPK